MNYTKLFNFYTRLRRGFIFSKRVQIVRAMEEAMLKAETESRRPETAGMAKIIVRGLNEAKSDEYIVYLVDGQKYSESLVLECVRFVIERRNKKELIY